MDIQLPLSSVNTSTLTKLSSIPATLKVGQQLDVQVLSTTTEAGKLSVNIKMGNNAITLQGDNFVSLTPGQTLQLQVVTLTPAPEFKLLDVKNTAMQSLATAVQSSAQQPASSTDTRSTTPPLADIRLTLSPSNTFSKPELAIPTALVSAPELASTQTVDFKIVGFSGNKVQLQVLTAQNELTSTANQTNSTKMPTILIDRAQLQQMLVNTKNTSTSPVSQPAAEIKIGQQLTFKINKSAGNTEFKIIPNRPANIEAQITQLVKQFLPRHEASPVLLNAIIKELPHILTNPEVPQAVKILLKSILANLPDTGQITTELGLKQSVKNSGILLEAQLAILAEQPDKVIDLEKDFKAGLLKLVHLLKQEATTTSPQNQDSNAVDLLKNLQQKTENTLAKISLDQLNNLPKDDNLKQVWNIDIPFLNKGNTESANVQIQWEKASQQDDKRPAAWSVNLTLNPPNIGTLYCTIAYQNNIVNTYFKSPSGKITNLLNNHLDLLKNQLEASGLKTGNLVAQQGNKANNLATQLPTQKLFDEQA